VLEPKIKVLDPAIAEVLTPPTLSVLNGYEAKDVILLMVTDVFASGLNDRGESKFKVILSAFKA
jgi:hypothetical protein